MNELDYALQYIMECRDRTLDKLAARFTKQCLEMTEKVNSASSEKARTHFETERRSLEERYHWNRQKAIAEAHDSSAILLRRKAAAKTSNMTGFNKVIALFN